MAKKPTWMDEYDKDKGWQGDKPKGSSWKTGQRCFHTHPAIKINGHYVFGGSCGTPVHDDCDIYIGLDYGMADHPERLPFNEGHAIHYKIPDMGVPGRPTEFKQLITWLATRIEKGDKVHIGCIGGHGRTGIVLAALVAMMTSEANAIGYVRENYCEKAVESEAQVKFLMHHFGVAEVKGAKTGWMNTSKVVPLTRNDVAPIQAKFCLWGHDIKPEQ